MGTEEQDREIARQLLERIDSQIRPLEEQLRPLYAKRRAARLLAGIDEPAEFATPQSTLESSFSSGIQLIRAKNVGELTYQFLRDHCPSPILPAALWQRLKRIGLNVGSRTYIYKILDELERENLIGRTRDNEVFAKKNLVERERGESDASPVESS